MAVPGQQPPPPPPPPPGPRQTSALEEGLRARMGQVLASLDAVVHQLQVRGAASVFRPSPGLPCTPGVPCSYRVLRCVLRVSSSSRRVRSFSPAINSGLWPRRGSAVASLFRAAARCALRTPLRCPAALAGAARRRGLRREYVRVGCAANCASREAACVACMTTARLCGLLRREVLAQRGTELFAAPPVAAPELAAARCARLQAIAVAAAMLSAAGAAVLFRRRAQCATAPRASRRGRAGFDKLGCASRGWPVCAAGLPAQRLAARGAPARRILDWRPRLP